MTAPTTDPAEAVERSLVGALLVRPEVAPAVFGVLPAADVLAVPRYRRAVEACLSLHQRGADISTPAMLAEYDTRGWDRGEYFGVLTEPRPGTDTQNEQEAAGYARAVLDGWRLRQCRERATSARTLADFQKLGEWVQNESGAPTQAPSLPDQVNAFLDKQHAIWEGRATEGYTWGLRRVDAYMLMVPGRTYGIAASKGHGKTWAMVALVSDNLREGVPVLVFSAEMPPVDLLTRIIAHRLGIDTRLFHSAEMDKGTWAKVERAARELEAEPLTIDGRSMLTTRDIDATVGAWTREHQVPEGEGLVCLDFVQRVSSERSGRADNIFANQAAVAYELTEVAKRHGVALLELIQLNKTGEQQRAHMSQVDGSGAFTQALDGLIMLELPNAKAENPAQSDGTCEELHITIPKNRYGAPRYHAIEYTADLSVGVFTETALDAPRRVTVGR